MLRAQSFTLYSMIYSLQKRPWWSYLEEDLQELVKESSLLLTKVGSWDEKFHDYAFIVFPAAKAYEGFLKKLFLDLNLITEEQFYGKRFRVGKALNPALRPRWRKRYGVYDKLTKFCGGDNGLADTLWDTWREARNVLFHWFPNEKNAVSFDEANRKFEMILYAFDKATKECNIR